jgi:F0F1-type ATP synthase epsilon subunit
VEKVASNLNVSIRSKKKTYFKGGTMSVTSLNDKGEFDILPGHANFISLISKYVVIDKGQDSEQKFIISNGILRVRENTVEVFLEVYS